MKLNDLLKKVNKFEFDLTINLWDGDNNHFAIEILNIKDFSIGQLEYLNEKIQAGYVYNFAMDKSILDVTIGFNKG